MGLGQNLLNTPTLRSGAYVGRLGGTTGTAAPLPWFNVKDYGAVGDGTTDDTTAIQAALTAVPTAGGVLYFPPSANPYICGSLAGRSNLVVQGPGMGAATVKQKAGTAVGPFDWGSYPTVTDVEIRDLTLDGNKANVTGGRGIQWVTSTRVRAVRVRVVNSYYQGIFAFQCTDPAVIDCETDSTGFSATTNGVGMGIAFNAGVRARCIGNRVSNANDAGLGGSGTACTDSVFADNVVVSPSFIGIAMASGGAGNTITGNTVTSTGDNGIDIANCTDTVVHGNTIQSAGHAGIAGDWSTSTANTWVNVTISGNMIHTTGATYQGCTLGGPAGAGGVRGIAFAGNVMNALGGHGLYLNNVNESTFADTAIRNPGGTNYAGIWLNGTCQRNSFRGIPVVDDTGLSWGIAYNGSVGGNNRFTDCDISQTTAGVLGHFQGNASAGDQFKGCAGVNPLGHTVAQPAVAATGVAVTNNQGADCMVLVQSGTVSQIAIGGTNTGQTSGWFRVPVSQTITLTYTVAPTWQWFGD